MQPQYLLLFSGEVFYSFQGINQNDHFHFQGEKGPFSPTCFFLIFLSAQSKCPRLQNNHVWTQQLWWMKWTVLGKTIECQSKCPFQMMSEDSKPIDLSRRNIWTSETLIHLYSIFRGVFFVLVIFVIDLLIGMRWIFWMILTFFCIFGFNSHLCALGVLHIGECAWPANIRAFSTFLYDQCDQDVDNVSWTEGSIYI